MIDPAKLNHIMALGKEKCQKRKKCELGTHL